MQNAEILGYQQDKKGFFRVVNGDRFRPLDIVNQKLTTDTLTLAMKRQKNREMVKHNENWWCRKDKSLWESLFSGKETQVKRR